MVIFEDIMEQNRKIALSVIGDLGVSVDDVIVEDFNICLVLGYDYLRKNFGHLFIENFFYFSQSLMDYSDMASVAYSHIVEVIENLDDFDLDIFDVLRTIKSNSDFVSNFDGFNIDAMYEVVLSDDELYDLAEQLASIEFGV